MCYNDVVRKSHGKEKSEKMAEEKKEYEIVTAQRFFNLIDSKAKRLLTCISDSGHCVTYVDKNTRVVAGYIVMDYNDVSKYYVSLSYDFGGKKIIAKEYDVID